MHVVLVNPEIPQNTGSIARTCAATRTTLNLVGELGFEISEKRVRRAGLDYWPYVDLKRYENFADFTSASAPRKIWLFSKYGSMPYYDAAFAADDALVFGSETKGLGEEFLSQFESDQILRIPMLEEKVRSLNLSNAVSITLYDALRQQNLLQQGMLLNHLT